MSVADDDRIYIEGVIEILEVAQALELELSDKLKHVNNMTQAWGEGSNNRSVEAIAITTQANDASLSDIRRRIKQIRDSLEEIWRRL